jgi:hypothetical protein
MRCVRILQIKDVIIPKSNYAEMKGFFERVDESDAVSIVLEPRT